MFSHIAVGTNDLEKAKRFYDAVLGALGYDEGINDDNVHRRRYVYRNHTGMFIITEPLDRRPATYANGGTVGFECSSAAQVDLWHAAGLANHGTSIEAPPGVREAPGGQLYLAYLRDPDGNKICGLYRIPS